MKGDVNARLEQRSYLHTLRPTRVMMRTRGARSFGAKEAHAVNVAQADLWEGNKEKRNDVSDAAKAKKICIGW